MKPKVAAVTIALIAVVLISVFAASQWLRSPPEIPEFYVGVEIAYANATASDVKVMVDRVKNFTNLIVVGAPEISINETALNETCDYIYDAGLHFIVLFTKREAYTTYDTFTWMVEAQQKYGKMFLGVYRYDEPGGNQLDRGREMLVTNATSYTDAAAQYTYALGFIINYYKNYAGQVFTADFALHWFDYQSNYSAVFAEFALSNTREISVAQCRGAARNFNRDFGVMLTWKYDSPPYIESGDELYNDMVLAYNNGAKYVIVFDYPKIDTYGIIAEEHFDALKKFWDYVHSNPQNFGSQKGEVAYVLPRDYAFGLRRADDKIWGLFEPDAFSGKVYSDVNKLVKLYGFGLDIVYDELGVVDAARNRYERLFFWNETIS
jgi:hypothetical protein